MARLLLRSGKDPFTPVAAESTFAQDTYNANVGNHLFQHSVHKALMTPDTEVVSDSTLTERRQVTERLAQQIDDEFDAFVVPLANAFRPEFADRLDTLTGWVKTLHIPVVVVGVGAQAPTDSAGFDDLAPVSASTRGFVAAVLDRSASIGVRGEFTAEYLAHLGFPGDAIEVIGCPSLFLHGPGFRLSRQSHGSLSADEPIALNATRGVAALGALVGRLTAAHPNLVYVGQDKDDLRLILWGDGEDSKDRELPTHLGHPLYRADRVRFPLDVWTWLAYLRGFSFVTGTRFHGNVAGLLAGTPSVLILHDSRTAELARHHGLPHVHAGEIGAISTADQLFQRYDPSCFDARYSGRFTAYVGFLERNRLDHIYRPGRANPAFEQRVCETTFPPLVVPLHSPDGDQVVARLRWLRDGQRFDPALHRQAYRPPFGDPGRRAGTPGDYYRRLRRRIARLETELADSSGRVATLSEEVERLRAGAGTPRTRTLLRRLTGLRRDRVRRTPRPPETRHARPGSG